MISVIEMKGFLLAITAVNVIDTISTVWLANKIGWKFEGNPFVRWSFQRLGVWPASTIKIGGAIVLAALLWQVCKRARIAWLPWLWFLGFAFVAAFNVGGVIALSGRF